MIASLKKPADAFESEFVTGSGIARSLYERAVRVVPDVVVLPGGDIETPIHDALNWRYTRFGIAARSAQCAALLLNEDGSTWQAKLECPRQDATKRKPIKYESPVGAGARAYLPPVPGEIRKAISERYSEDVPMSGSFWSWLEEHPEIPVIWTEGAKKALSLLSHGYVAIALYGVNGGYRKQIDGTRVLIPDVERFANRSQYLAFDQDTSEETRRRVNVSLLRFSALLEATKASVSIIEWDSKQGKGVDDLIVNVGIEAFTKLLTEAMNVCHWRIHQRMLKQLTYPVSVHLLERDLADVEIPSLPDSGIVALSSAKGTGKTKFIRSLTEGTDKVLSATHRIALGRNLCSRLGLHWRGDLDKVGGHFITGDAYTLRVGFCVDSILSIHPEKFEGCDLVLDEVVQVVRHLVTSSTCSKDGKRASLLTRFTELLQKARRVICADADLDNATLHYLQELRSSDEPVYLIRNQYKTEGYSCTFIEAPDRTALTARLVKAVQSLPQGKAIFIATDSKAYSKACSAVLRREAPHLRVLVINSETSGGDLEREFMKAPDRALQAGEYDIIICSPSMATGVSIEASGTIAAVYGIFMGVSSTDADMAQSLSRVREVVPRFVWCARVGTNYARASRSQNYLEVKSHLQQQTSAVVRLVRNGLAAETVGGISEYGWQDNPHLNLYCRLSAAQNFSMAHLRDALLVRLRLEGNTVTVLEQETNPAIKMLLRQVREEQRFQDAETLVSAEDISYSNILLLEQKEVKTPEENLAIAKHYLKDFYCLDSLTVDDVLWDNEGRRRSELLSLEVQLYPELSRDRTVRALEKQAGWGKGFTPWDISTIELKRVLRDRLGLPELIQRMASGWEWTKYDLAPYAARARALSKQVKVALNFTIHDGVSDTQIVHELLLQLGIRRNKHIFWSSAVPGHKGEKLRVYAIDMESFQHSMQVLESRRLKRDSFDTGSPPDSIDLYKGGDLDTETVDDEASVYAELLIEANSYGIEAVKDLWEGIPSRLHDELRRFLPLE